MSHASKNYFDALGGEWDGMREEFFSQAVRERALEAAAVQAGRVAADVGAGTGFMTEGLLARGLEVVAVDQSAVMLAALDRKLPPGSSIDCRQGGAEKLPMENDCVDYCFANMLLHHVEAPGKAILEMARIVRPGGQVLVTDLDAHEHEFLQVEHHDRWPGFARSDIKGWFQEAGLQGVRIESVDEQCRATSCRGEAAAVEIFLGQGTVPGSSVHRPSR